MGGRKSKAQRTVMDSHSHIQQEQTKGGPPKYGLKKKSPEKKTRSCDDGWLPVESDIWIQLFNV